MRCKFLDQVRDMDFIAALAFLIVFIFSLAFSVLMVCAVTWAVCTVFGWAFSFWLGVCVWIVLFAVFIS